MNNTPLPAGIGKPATRALVSNGIACLEDLTRLSENELHSMHGVGPQAIRILKEALSSNHLSLSK